MCGIAGIVNFNKRPVEGNAIESMLSVLRHRGPDDIGTYSYKYAKLGHTRLSIIDLSKDAHQPMPNEDSSIIVIHNGEIYNYLELRAELEGLGHRFKSKSDTEVIIHSYEQWGEECLKHFNGMWSFAILDTRKNTLFCSRDRFGVKPFYYYIDDEVFVFASEIKSLLKHPKVKNIPNDAAIYSYLISGYGYMDISDDTFFKKIKQLKPAHFIKLNIGDGKFLQKRYWDLDPNKRSGFKEEEKAYEKFYELFEDSVRIRLRSDVPVGVSLSGGLDSSSIACVAARILKDKRLEAFSSCFEEEEYDERKFIQPVLNKTGARANYIFTKPEDLFDEIEKIIWHQDEPYSTLSIFPQWYVMKLAKERGVKVLLTGQGGDETLGGYHKYYFYLFADLIYSLKWAKAFREAGIYKKLKGQDVDIIYPTLKILMSYIMPQFVKKCFKEKASASQPSYLNKDFAINGLNTISTERRHTSILNNDLYNALKISPLPSLLHIDDRSSMAHSVESRAPFLDYRLVEYLFSLGPEFKIRDGFTKYILRTSLKGVLPEEVRTRRDKMGFATPLEKWIKTDIKDNVLDILSSQEFSSRGYFNRDAVIKIFDDYTKGKSTYSHFTIWSWVNLELWLRKFIDW